MPCPNPGSLAARRAVAVATPQLARQQRPAGLVQRVAGAAQRARAQTPPQEAAPQRQQQVQQQVQVQQQQQREQGETTQQQRRRPRLAAGGLAAFGAAAAVSAALAACPEARAAGLIAEPANALSLPTWAIHVSSVAEWLIAIGLFWRYAEVSGNPRWKGMSWAMLPALGSAMSACTWHFFYNSPDLDFMVAMQAALTVIGNATCWLAAYRIYAAAKAQPGA
ncbi:ycf49 [Raphidocelis subcapitata]|uniref:Ycf49 n=1 Tax=Raphidocelis subcapitata TaxID=307507 RepID=A0A2V0P1Q1_9CHLO|nr:ycf49 [Raphidocelis subcapitata]|eukprot:GBF92852.1 ycf49 [Raphidocelis subcapitata]